MIKCITAEPSLAKNSNTWFSQCVFKRNIPLHFTIAANVPCVMSSARGAIYPSLKRTNWPWSWFYKQLGISITDFTNALLLITYCWKTSPKKSHFRNVFEKYRGMFVCNFLVFIYLLGSLVDKYHERVAAWGQIKENRPHQDSHWVRPDSLRDVDGRHPISTIQIKQSDGGWRLASQSQERCARHHPWIHSLQAAA